jgi:ubiquinone/menaquinone biosynthesis C-methylase UbiE
MTGYYADRLHGERLKRCYDLAPSRVQQYLEAEMDYVARHIVSGDSVVELGCGYGRVMQYLSKNAGTVYGIDISFSNIEYARNFLQGYGNCRLAVMDAARTAFADDSFEHVVCIQNGLSALHVSRKALVEESIRIVKTKGKIFYSSYSPRFWSYRLHWFEMQANEGLIGEIDHDKTRDGVIVCNDGFSATTVTPEQFRGIIDGIEVRTHIEEVDESSLFFVLNT